MAKKNLLICLFLSPLFLISSMGQVTTLKQKIEQIIDSKNAGIGVAIGGPEDRDTIIVNGAAHYPMQSVYKFHIAIAVLDQVDKGRFTIDQKIPVKKSDLLPKTWSPLRDNYPDGNITPQLKELLYYAVSKSDNNACDILIRLLGGTKEINKYLHAIGIKDVSIAATEEESAKSWEVQYTNWSTPYAAIQLLRKFHDKTLLSPKMHDLLFDLMVNSLKDDRIKGLLPEGTRVAHKTGTSGTNPQNITTATNDIGIINLPDGKHFTIAVFVADSKYNDSANSAIIASIAKAAWDYYLDKSQFAARQHFDVAASIDSLLNTKTKNKTPFNGTILVSQNGRKIYSKVFGFSDFEKKTVLLPNDQYVIGAISTQVTAVLILQEVEKGHILLQKPIRTYLPDLSEKWADTVTVHQLLTHTHGIVDLTQPLAFRPGYDFQYSELGYDLLTKILEAVTNKTFANLSAELFEKCNMRSTFHPDLHKHKNLVKSYTVQPDGKLLADPKREDDYMTTGGFISTVNDLLTWNNYLYGGKLFTDSNNNKLMTTGYAIMKHPVMGKVDYGYGLTISTKDDYLKFGQTGFFSGYVSLNYYFPATKTTVIVLSNVARDTESPTSIFLVHTQILDILKQSNLIIKGK